MIHEYIEVHGIEQDDKVIPKGENPARDIDVPSKDKAGRKVSYHARTVLEARATPEEYVTPIMEDVENGKYSHDVIICELVLAYFF